MNFMNQTKYSNTGENRPTALVTGGSRGIGLGIATELAKAGFNLAINGIREEEEVKPVVESLESFGVEVLYVRGNVSVRTEREKMVEDVIARFGQIHLLINNAGIAPAQRNDILMAQEEHFEEVLKVNLQGPYFLTQQVAKLMIGWKSTDPETFFSIINISSVSATVASVNRGEYCISKAGIAMSTLLWAARLGEYDIPVYEIRPGVIRTDMTRGVEEKYDRLFAGGLAVQSRWGTPEDVGRAAAALATRSFPYSTGQVVMVDGGMTLNRL